MEETERVDLVVVGAGWYGLKAASTYQALQPTASIRILESSSTVGGSWAQHRIFDGLRSNNMLGTYEYPDFPMETKTFGVKPGEHIPGQVVHEYLSRYAAVKGLDKLTMLNTRVHTIEKQESAKQDGWMINATSNGQPIHISASKLIIAAGLTSSPSMPIFEGQDTFMPLLIHSYDLPKHQSTFKSKAHVVVIGGAKSAWDAAYKVATSDSNSTVTMLIRPSGSGPVWMAPAYVTPFRLWLEKLIFTRFFTWMSPCIWGFCDGFSWPRRFLHNTRLGRKIVQGFWKVLGDDVIDLNGFDKPGNEKIRKLKPWWLAFEIGNGLSILNYPTNFFDLVRAGKINVLWDEVDRLDNRSIVLKSGQKLDDVDALICCTGWTSAPNIKFLPESLSSQLGLPSNAPIPHSTASATARANLEIYNRLPYLATRPPGRTGGPAVPTQERQRVHDSKTPNQPYQLHRFMVPPALYTTRSIAFAGAMMCLSHSINAEIQALWIAAYLSGSLTFSSNTTEESIMRETILHTRYCALRHRVGYGEKFPDIVFDTVPYFDMLVRDLGLRCWRKGGMLGWVREPFVPYGPGDYRGLVGEYKRVVEERRGVVGGEKLD